MEEKELTPNEIRGVDLIVKSLKKKYNFIQGWEPVDDYTKYYNTLFVHLLVDYDMVSDYFGIRIRPSIKLQLNDLERVGELGYVDGISNIIVKSLNSLDETKRPVHCTDKKRETVYIKDADKWEHGLGQTKPLCQIPQSCSCAWIVVSLVG